MRNELSQIQEIETYLSGAMTPSEHANFETKMQLDVDLKEDVDLQKSIAERLQFLAFKADVIALHGTYVSSQKSWWKKGLYLNSFLLLIVLLTVSTIVSKITNEPPTQPEVELEAVPNLGLNEELVQTEIPQEEFVEPILPIQSKKSETKKINSQPHLAFQKLFEKANLNATQGGTITTKDSKSSIHFDPQSLVDKNGNIVNGNVEIRYREYRNQADMAFSGIPMVYDENGNDYLFNSAGMIEVRAFLNDEELYLKPGADFTIDYNATQQVDSCFFFALDDETQKWEKRQRIDFDSINRSNSLGEDVEMAGDGERMNLKNTGMLQGKVDQVARFTEPNRSIVVSLYYPLDYGKKYQPAYRTVVRDGSFRIDQINKGSYVAEMGCDGCDNIVVDTLIIYPAKVSQLDATVSILLEDSRRTRRLLRKGRNDKLNGWAPSKFELKDSVHNVSDWNNSDRKKLYDSLTINSVDAKEASMALARKNIVSGLSCEGFGIYNCDQINRVINQVDIKPKFVNSKGIVIVGIYILSMIDLNINAAFSFSKDALKIERGGKTVVLAFSADTLYGISADKTKAMNIDKNGEYIFYMEDLTEQIKNTDDLKKYLGI